MIRSIVLILIFIVAQNLNAQHIDSILQHLNQPFQENIEETIAEMFGDQDTIFTETDSFILYTTPDMIVEELDTIEYKYNPSTKTYAEWNYNGDEIAEATAMVYLSDKRTGKPINSEWNQFLVITKGIEEDSFIVQYFKDILPCITCGMDGGEPEITIIPKENKLELITVTSIDDYYINKEFLLSFEEEELVVNEHSSDTYHMTEESTYSTEVDRSTMMERTNFESSDGNSIPFKMAIIPAEMIKKITIDGELDEEEWNRDYKTNWRPVHSTLTGEKHTMNDLFAKYSIKWDQKSIYIGLKVKDDKLVPIEYTEGEMLGDYLELIFDFSQYRISRGQLKTEMGANSVRFGIGFDKAGVPVVKELNSGQFIEDIQTTFLRKKEKGGYHAEIQIPTRVFKELINLKKKRILGIGNSINFTLCIGDSDNRETKEVKHIDASSSLDQYYPFYLGKIELFKTFKHKPLEQFLK